MSDLLVIITWEEEVFIEVPEMLPLKIDDTDRHYVATVQPSPIVVDCTKGKEILEQL